MSLDFDNPPNFDYIESLGFVPYTGATTDVDLGSQNLTTTGAGTFNNIDLTSATSSTNTPLNANITAAYDGGGIMYVADFRRSIAAGSSSTPADASFTGAYYEIKNAFDMTGDGGAFPSVQQKGVYFYVEDDSDDDMTASFGSYSKVMYPLQMYAVAKGTNSATGSPNLKMYGNYIQTVSQQDYSGAGTMTQDIVGQYINPSSSSAGNLGAGSLTANVIGTQYVLQGGSSGTHNVTAIDINTLTGNGTLYGFKMSAGSSSISNWLTRDDQKNYFGSGQDASIYFDGSDLIINSEDVTADDEVHFTNWAAIDLGLSHITTSGIGSFGSANINGALNVNGGGSHITIENGSVFINSDNNALYVGADNDLEIYHNGTNTYIENNTGALVITNNDGTDRINMIGYLDVDVPSGNSSGFDLDFTNTATTAITLADMRGDQDATDNNSGYDITGLTHTITNAHNITGSGGFAFQQTRGIVNYVDTDSSLTADNMIIDETVYGMQNTCDISSKGQITGKSAFGDVGITCRGIFNTISGNSLQYNNASGSFAVKAHGLYNYINTQSPSLLAGTFTLENIGEYIHITSGNTGSVYTTCFGVYVGNITGGDEMWAFYNNTTAAHNLLGKDNVKSYFGTGSDASIYFDGSDLIINSENITANDEVHFTNWDAVDFSSADLTTTGDITCNTLNYTTLNPAVNTEETRKYGYLLGV